MESEAEGPAPASAGPPVDSRLRGNDGCGRSDRWGENDGGDGKREGPSFIFKDLALIQLAALVVLCDQATKFLVREYLQLSQSVPAEGFFRITHTYNTGSAFGLFQGQNTPLIVVAVVGIFILGMIYRSQRPPSNLLRLSLGLQVGGAIGNLTDRLLFGHVTDFLDVGAWPIFNLADSSIVVGLVLLAWVFLKPGRKRVVSQVEGPALVDTASTCDASASGGFPAFAGKTGKEADSLGKGADSVVKRADSTRERADSVDGPGLAVMETGQPSDSRLERYEEYRRWLRLDR